MSQFTYSQRGYKEGDGSKSPQSGGFSPRVSEQRQEPVLFGQGPSGPGWRVVEIFKAHLKVKINKDPNDNVTKEMYAKISKMSETCRRQLAEKLGDMMETRGRARGAAP
eukprot:gene9597-19301_t